MKGVPLYTDARLYAEAGIPTVLYGAGPRTLLEANGHAADEHVAARRPQGGDQGDRRDAAGYPEGAVAMRRFATLIVAALVFAFLAATLLTRPPPPIEGFDQSFYYTIAYDLDRHHTYTNGIFGPTGSETEAPPPGMFFMPLYPALVWAVTQVDGRYAAAIACANQVRYHRPDTKPCTPYSRPMMIVHALLLTIGIMAVGFAARLLIASPSALPVTAAVAALGIYSHAGLFSYMMTESLAFCLYSLAMLAFLHVVQRGSPRYFALAGVVTALVGLARPSFLALAPLFIVLFLAQRWPLRRAAIPLARIALFALFFGLTLLPWQVRNYVSVGKFALTEEYGPQQLVERMGYNTMTLREGLMAFPAGLPQIGVSMTAALFGTEGMRRFGWSEPDGFYETGMRRRHQLIAEHGRIGPIIVPLMLAELRENWWRWILTTIPIAWCGLWVGQLWGLLLIPVFGAVAVSAIRRGQTLFLLYAFPALAMGLVHGAVANQNVRYNIGFMGPISIAVAYAVLLAVHRLRRKTVSDDVAPEPALS